MMPNRTPLKPSIVLSAMVAGLLKSEDDPLFRVDMGTFGEVLREICYGCAATLTLAEMFGKGKSASEMMLGHVKAHPNRSEGFEAVLSDVIKSDASIPQDSLPVDLSELEFAVNNARIGYVSVLIEILTGKKDSSFDDQWHLGSENWKGQLPVVEATIAEMIKAGY